MDFLRINGALGEGGGQIVRTAISLSCITGTPIILENIRKNRKVPGLRPQHLTAIKILKKICNAKVEGAKVGSTNFKFTPNEVQSLSLKEDVGTAGSIPLILQVLVPVVALSGNNLRLSIRGGTDGKWSPTSSYTQYILREAWSKMGIQFSMNVLKRGYYPKGGGKTDVSVSPSKKTIPLVLKKRKTKNCKIFCSYSKIPKNDIEKNVNLIKEKLLNGKFRVESEIVEETALDPGGSILIFSKDSDSIIGVDSLYDQKNGTFDHNLVGRFIQNNMSVDENLSDMLVLPASLAKGMTVFQVPKITKHLETNLYITSKITGCRYGIGKLQDGYEIRIEGVSNSGIK